MKAMIKWLAGAATAATAATLLVAAPASAQYYDYYDRYRDRDTADAVVEGVARVAGAVAAATQGYDPRYGYGSRYGYGYSTRGFDRFAADACAYEAQRRLGRRYDSRVGVNILDVRPTSRYDRVRVTGVADLGGYYGGYDRYYRYGSYNRGRIGIACTVRGDGRVTDFDTNRYAYGYRY